METDQRARSNGASADPRFRPLLVTYRSACRTICSSLQESRRTADGATAVMLSGLLQRLEKQLWLLDYSRDRLRIGLPAINAFLSC